MYLRSGILGCAETTQVWQLQALALVKEHRTQVLKQPRNGWWCILQEMICVLHIMDNSALIPQQLQIFILNFLKNAVCSLFKGKKHSRKCAV
jgi:hypothetical protein